jgi:hypothetical protein
VGETPEQKKQRLRREDLQRLREMRPIDDDFMRCIFRDNKELAQKVLRILIQNKTLNIVSVETQVDMKRLVGARSICLDALGIDDNGKKYDMEIQRSDKGAGAHRARYHSSVLDVESLRAGEEFEELPETYVIFITENDIYKKGLPFYRIERINIDTDESFNDGAHILYVNGAYRGNDDIGNLMHDFLCPNPDDMLDEDLAKVSRYYKETQEGVVAVSKMMDDMRNEAALETAREIAERLIAKGLMSYEDIADITALSLSEVQKLASAVTA